MKKQESVKFFSFSYYFFLTTDSFVTDSSAFLSILKIDFEIYFEVTTNLIKMDE